MPSSVTFLALMILGASLVQAHPLANTNPACECHPDQYFASHPDTVSNSEKSLTQARGVIHNSRSKCSEIAGGTEESVIAYFEKIKRDCKASCQQNSEGYKNLSDACNFECDSAITRSADNAHGYFVGHVDGKHQCNDEVREPSSAQSASHGDHSG
jgi:hypothetical protein